MTVLPGQRPDLPVPHAAFANACLVTSGPVAATAPSVAALGAPCPASDARSFRACRSARRTAKPTCPVRCGSPGGPRRAQAALRRCLPHPDLARREPGLPRLEEARFPPADRLLAELLALSSLGDRLLAGEDTGHDRRLPLHRGFTGGVPTVKLFARDSINRPATKPEARHRCGVLCLRALLGVVSLVLHLSTSVEN